MYLCLSLCLLYRAVSILMFISTLWDVCKFGIEIHLYPAPLFSRSIYIRFTYLSLCCASAVPGGLIKHCLALSLPAFDIGQVLEFFFSFFLMFHKYSSPWSWYASGVKTIHSLAGNDYSYNIKYGTLNKFLTWNLDQTLNLTLTLILILHTHKTPNQITFLTRILYLWQNKVQSRLQITISGKESLGIFIAIMNDVCVRHSTNKIKVD